MALRDLLLVSLSWWAISLSGVLAPGPVSALAVSEGARRGAVAGPLVTLGHALAEAAMFGALAAGTSRILQHPAVVGTIGLAGGIVLAWMGWGIVQTARRSMDWGAGPAAAGPGIAGGGAAVVRAGLLATVANPYWLLWWATVGAAYYVLFARFGAAALLALFLAGHLALDLGWCSLLALVVGAGRGRIPQQVYRAALAVCGVFVMATSLYFASFGVTLLRTPP
ncbi:MAG: LysE family transporter [Armatimonadota bacterium]|nr:LysE family transporter [Armatimonadota bacterium]MDR7534972.1 LysE family transporter [Armatimonadota bacterium]